MTRRAVTVRAPATSANLGPGFDCLGAALDLCNELAAELGGSGLEIEVAGEGLGQLSLGPDNRVAVAFRAACAALGMEPPPLRLRLLNRIPLARGLGSSSAAAIAGLVAANALLGGNLSQERLLELAVPIEGHPDNVVPALLGGVTVCVSDGPRVLYQKLALPPAVRDLSAVLYVPDFPMDTGEARRILPPSVPRLDGVFNTGRAALLVVALQSGRLDLLRPAMEDRLHQPYRAQIFPALPRLCAAALEAGALGAALSGAGSTILALARAPEAGAVESAMARAARALGVTGRPLRARLSEVGATVVDQE